MLHFTICFSLPSTFWCSWVDWYSDRSSTLWTDETVLSNFFLDLESANLNAPSDISFPTPVPSSVHEYSNTFLTQDPAWWPCSTSPPKFPASSEESRDTSSFTYHSTKVKRSKLPLSFGPTFRRWPASSSLWKPSPNVSNKSTKFDYGSKLSFPLFILLNTLAAALEKSESGSSSTPYFTYSITVFRLSCP